MDQATTDAAVVAPTDNKPLPDAAGVAQTEGGKPPFDATAVASTKDKPPPDGAAVAPREINHSGDAAPAGRRPFALRYLRIKRRARRFFLILKGLFGLGLSLAGATAGVVLLVLLGVELTRHQIEIQPIAVPKFLAEAGYFARGRSSPLAGRPGPAGGGRGKCRRQVADHCHAR